VLHAEDSEDDGEKCGISGKTDVGRGDIINSADPENPVLQPILGNVSINERIGYDCGKAENEKKTESESSERRRKKETEVLAHQFAHRANIAVSVPGLRFFSYSTGSGKKERSGGAVGFIRPSDC
jgi:hypothetical protein